MSKKRSGGFIETLAGFIVDKRNLIFLLYIFAFVFCIFSMNWVVVENDVTTYLSEETETRQGLDAMNANFVTNGSARIMVANITYETAEQLLEQIQAVDGVTTRKSIIMIWRRCLMSRSPVKPTPRKHWLPWSRWKAFCPAMTCMRIR